MITIEEYLLLSEEQQLGLEKVMTYDQQANLMVDLMSWWIAEATVQRILYQMVTYEE